MATIEKRASKDGAHNYRVKVRMRGHAPLNATFERLTDARRWAQSTESALREGRYQPVAEARKHTVADLLDRYSNEVVPHKPKNAANIKNHIKWWRAEIGHVVLHELTAAKLAECRSTLLTGITRRKQVRSPATVVRYLATMSHALNTAVREWQWLTASPMRQITKPKEPRGRDRFLSDAERAALLAACRESSSKFLYPVVVLALSTGMRHGEIMNLRWPAIDLERGQIMLRDTKNGSPRAIPLAGHAHEQIKALAADRRTDTDLVFPSAVLGTPEQPAKPIVLKKRWEQAVKDAGITNCRFHDLRHSAASYLAMNGASTIEIAAVLGHKTLQMVKRYSHLANSHTAQVVGAMNAKIFGSAS